MTQRRIGISADTSTARGIRFMHQRVPSPHPAHTHARTETRFKQEACAIDIEQKVAHALIHELQPLQVRDLAWKKWKIIRVVDKITLQVCSKQQGVMDRGEKTKRLAMIRRKKLQEASYTAVRSAAVVRENAWPVRPWNARARNSRPRPCRTR